MEEGGGRREEKVEGERGGRWELRGLREMMEEIIEERSGEKRSRERLERGVREVAERVMRQGEEVKRLKEEVGMMIKEMKEWRKREREGKEDKKGEEENKRGEEEVEGRGGKKGAMKEGEEREGREDESGLRVWGKEDWKEWLKGREEQWEKERKKRRSTVWKGVEGKDEKERMKRVEEVVVRELGRDAECGDIVERRGEGGKVIMLVELKEVEDKERLLRRAERIRREWGFRVDEDLSLKERRIRWLMVKRAKVERKSGRNVVVENRRMWIEGEEWVWDEKEDSLRRE